MMSNEVELFEWNGVISIREKASKKTVLTIWRPICPACSYVMDGEARLDLVRKEVGPKLVEMMNGLSIPEPLATQAPQTFQESPLVDSNRPKKI